ncbi:MAG: dipeptidase [Gemmatimonadota bacterium]|nr:MAG: dipeptidase [Gemmatimonadota bacterium]
MRASAVLGACMASLMLTACPVGTGALSEEEFVARARAIHESVVTIDSHDDIPADFATDEVDPGVRGDRQVDLPKMREGGLDAAFFIVYVNQTERTPENYERAKQEARTRFDAIHRMTDSLFPGQIELAYSADDVERIVASGKLVAAIGIENGYAIGRELSLLADYHELGARYVTLSHNGHNDICDSAIPRSGLGDEEEEHGGVSEFGARVIEEMNRLGIMVDVSHVSRNSMLDAVRLSRAPVIASHSSTRALADVARNLDDEQLLALKESGGVAQMVAVGSFVNEGPPEKVEALQALREEMGVTDYEARAALSGEAKAEYEARREEIEERWPVTVPDFVDHIDYAVRLIGIDHVGIASDFDGGGGVQGWNDAGESFNVTLELVRRGYTEEDVRKLWGGNLLRVWREVERVAAGMQAASGLP